MNETSGIGVTSALPPGGEQGGSTHLQVAGGSGLSAFRVWNNTKEIEHGPRNPITDRQIAEPRRFAG